MRKITEEYKLKYDNIFAKLMNISVDELHFDKLKLNESICANDNAWQKHKTPDSICKQMIDLYSFSDSDKILVLFNLELVKELIGRKVKKENIYFISDYHTKSDFLSKYFKEINYINLNEYSINDLEEKIKSFNVKKFDVVFSNPPYNGNIDLKILKNLFNFSKYIVFIHPGGFLYDKKFMTNLYNDIRNTNYLEKAIFFWGNKLFNINLFSPVCITFWNTTKKDSFCKTFDNITNENYVTNINDISIHGNNSLVKEFRNFVNKLNSNTIYKNIKEAGNLSHYSVRFALIRGGCTKGVNPDKSFWGHFESFFGKDYNSYKCDEFFSFSEASKASGQPKPIFSFNSEEERNNFISYCKTKIVRFIISFTKTGANITKGELNNIPWMDFTQEWNDAKLCQEFNISNELWEYIDNFIPNYYDDYKSGF